MRRVFPRLAVIALLLFIPLSVFAAEIEGLQPPAWLERAGQKQPLRPGMVLRESDVVETGKGGRLLIALADGSFVKLGEQAQLSLESLKEHDAQDGVLRGLFEVLKGAFRYTAGAAAHLRQRDLQVQIATTTVGIRGTDVWGRSQDGGATVCLIEGRIRVQNPARGEFEMDQPLSFFVAPREGEPQPVVPVDPEKLKQWSAETDLALGHGVLLPGGGWIVQLGSHADEASARAVAKQLLDSGVPVELTTVQLKSRTFYRLRVSGFDTQQDARTFADSIRGWPGIPKPWVTCSIPGSRCM